MPYTMPFTTPVGQARTAGQRRPLSLSFLQRVSPNEVPYSDEERAFARGRRGDELQGRQNLWEAQRRGDFGAAMIPRFGRSPQMESEVAQLQSPSWASFWDTMADQPYLAGGRGMRGDVDLVGEGVGSGTGLGRATARVREPGGMMSPSIDLEDLYDDANARALPGRQRQLASRAFDFLMRGR